MKARRIRLPSICFHRPSGRDYVRLAGKMIYLGVHADPGNQARYERLMAEYLGSDRTLPSAPDDRADGYVIADLIADYLCHAKSYYRRPDGSITQEVQNVKEALRPLLRLYGQRAAARFGPKQLKAYRQHLIDRDLARGLINKRVSMVRRAFRWAASDEKLPATTFHALQAVEGLRAGRSSARETQPVLPVEWRDVNATLSHLRRPIAAMVMLQWWCGARPGEVLTMRTGDIDRTRTTWLYRPRAHKCQHLGKQRVVPIGPKGQEIITPFLRLDPEEFVFQPVDAEHERREVQGKARKTKVPPSQISRAQRNHRWPKRRFNDCYSTRCYRQAVHRACCRAGIEPWHPNQLRHAAATRLRKEFGLEAARVVLGHSSSAVTEIYAEIDQTRALQIMEQVG